MEDKEEVNQDHNYPSLLPNNRHKTITTNQESHKKTTGGGGDRLKRDEWSEGAVCSLLEAYEAKWVVRNRAKLKGRDWEDVARHVSSRANSTKSPKTQTQCKNKIESMKKRYRSESATTTADASTSSSWPLYSRLDLLLRGTGGPISTQTQPAPSQSHSPNLGNNLQPLVVLLDPSPPPQPVPLAAPAPPLPNAQNSHGSNGVDKLVKEGGLATKSSDHVSNKNPMDTDSSTPALYSEEDKSRCNKRKMKIENNKRRRKEDIEVAESLRCLAEVVVRSEQARMDTMKEIERMRVEAEAKRGEMDLKRTEIIANTQLEIARIFANVNKDIDSSLRTGRS